MSTLKTFFDLDGDMDWSVVSTNTNVLNNKGYIVDTSSGPVTLTLPASPVVGESIGIKDLDNNFGANNLTINRNGKLIGGVASNMVISTDGYGNTLVYSGSIKGWLLSVDITTGVTSVSGTAPIASSGGNTPAISITAATTSAAGSMSSTDKTKLDGIEAGATADMTATEILDAVKTVDGTGSGLDADLLDGHDTSYFQTALGFTPEDSANKNATNGYAGLSGGKLDAAQLPAVAITDTFVVATSGAMVALTAEVGDVAIRTDENKSYILQTSPASTLSNWLELLTSAPASTQTFKTISVSGQSDVVADNTTDTLTLVAGTNITITTDAATDAITINSSGSSGGAGITWSIKTTNATAAANNGYLVDTTASQVTITLPATAAVGDQVAIVDKNGLFDVNKVIVARNGHNIMGVAEDFDCDSKNLGITFVYSNTTEGWRVSSSTSFLAAGSGLVWAIAVSNTSASTGRGYFVDTTTGQVTITLPVAPVIGDQVAISDLLGTFALNKCVVARNGKNIMGVAEDLDLDVQNLGVLLVYSNATEGWKVVYTASGFGGSGGTGGASLTWNSVATNTSTIANNGYFVDTTSAQVTLTLPPSVTIGDTISVIDYTGNFGTNPCIIENNGHNIMGTLDDFSCNINNMGITFVYVDATEGWKISSTTSASGGGSGSSIIWHNVSEATAALVSNGYFVDTSAGQVVVTLPATAEVGDTIEVADYAGTFGTNNCVIARNGHKIMGVAEDFNANMNNLGLTLVYSDVTQGWKITSSADGVGAGGSVEDTWSIVNTNTTTVTGNGYFVNTSGAQVTMTLPMYAAMGDRVSISDYAGSFGVNKCVVNRNGHKIMGVAENFECDVPNLGILLVYVDVTQGWRVVYMAGAGGDTIQNYSRRNYIINGNFDIWQRATSQTSDGYGSDDRYANGHTGSTKVHSRQVFTLGQTDVPGNPKYFSRTAVTSVGGASNNVFKNTKIEYVQSLAGKKATLSFWAKADAPKNIAIEFYQSFGSGGSPSVGISSIGSQLVALTTSWVKYTITVDIPSITGKTLGTNGNDYLMMYFWFDAGSSFNVRTASLGQQSGTFDIAQVQLEEGEVATEFERRTYGEELALCQRYYEDMYNLIITGYAPAGRQVYSCITFAVTKRAPAIFSYGTINYENSTDFQSWDSSNTGKYGWYGNITITTAGFGLAYARVYADAEL
jgi:hypothetical protein